MQRKILRVCAGAAMALLLAGCSSPTGPRLPTPGEHEPTSSSEGQAMLTPISEALTAPSIASV